MRQLFAILSVLTLLVSFTTYSFALDPVAPRSFRSKGILWVKTPNPSQDVVSVTQLKTGKTWTVPSDKTQIVPVGKYDIKVQMQNYTYHQKVLVQPTERADVVVAGYGNIKVNSPFQGEVMVYQNKSKNPTAKFPVNEIKTLPRGHYDVKIVFANKTQVMEPNVWIVTNTTRQLDVVEPKSKKK